MTDRYCLFRIDERLKINSHGARSDQKQRSCSKEGMFRLSHLSICLRSYKILFWSDGMTCCRWNLLQKHLLVVYQRLKSKRKHVTFKFSSTSNYSEFLLQSKCMFVLCREVSEAADAAQARDLLKRFNVCLLSFIFCSSHSWAYRLSNVLHSCSPFISLISRCLIAGNYPEGKAKSWKKRPVP